MLAALDCERLLDLADSWRRDARRWTAAAEECGVPAQAELLRTRAGAALYAAWEADHVFVLRQDAADRAVGYAGRK